jgi:peptidoglycan hydrolase-like protein with peptidoglycan-binding domain
LRFNKLVTRLATIACGLALTLSVAVTPAAAKSHKTKHKHAATTTKGKARHGKAAKKGKAAKRGQQAIQNDRAREIQSALIREHYMNGEPTGTFDDQTREALVKFQGDHGWQTKVVPDSRALIKLGLGPDRSHLLNPADILTKPDSARDQVPGGAQLGALPTGGAQTPQ